jgi:hypothetical protein
MSRRRPSSQLQTTLQPRMRRVEVQFGLASGSSSTLRHHIVSSAVNISYDNTHYTEEGSRGMGEADTAHSTKKFSHFILFFWTSFGRYDELFHPYHSAATILT